MGKTGAKIEMSESEREVIHRVVKIVGVKVVDGVVET